MGLIDILQHSWNAFFSRDPTTNHYNRGMTYSYRPDRRRFTGGNERSIITALFNRMAMDAASIDIKHVRLDENDRYVETVKSGLNDCLSLEANLDQTGQAFLQDIYASMLDEGVIAIVPVDTSVRPNENGSFDIYSMRTGKIVEWASDAVKVNLYNERKGRKEEIWVKKRNVAIVENPLYAIVNERNSTVQRLIRKLNLLDAVDEQSSSGKMDLIIQLPYTVRGELRRQQAEERRKSVEEQLTGSKYGIAYIDGTERVTQLNRPIENNLLKQVEYLTNMAFSQIGITQSIMDGTADEKTMQNYYTRITERFVSAVVDEMKRKFLSKTARSQRQSIVYFRDPFGLMPVSELAEIADKFTRNKIATSNEIRQIIGMKPSDDPSADRLENSNNIRESQETIDESNKEGEIQNGEL